MELAWGTFACKVIRGSFGALIIFWKYDFQNATSSTLFMIFFNQIFIGVPCDSPQKSYFLEFRNINK